MKLRFRIDGNDDQRVLDFLKMYYAYVLVYHELPHGNPHYHAYVDDKTDLSIDAFRARVKRYFKTQKSSDYSVKKCDDDKVNEYVQYLFNTKHGNKWELISSRNFDTKLIADLQNNAQKITDDFEERTNKRPSGEKSRLTQFQLGLEVYDEWKAQNKDDMLIHELTEIAMDVCWKHSQTPEPNKLIKIISVSLSRHQRGRLVLVGKLQNYFQTL